MDDGRFDGVMRSWAGRAPRRGALRLIAGFALAGVAGSIRAAGEAAGSKRGLKAGQPCNPAQRRQCRSGVCGCTGGTACACRIRRCHAVGQSCRKTGNYGCCEGVCLADTLTCVV